MEGFCPYLTQSWVKTSKQFFECNDEKKSKHNLKHH